MTEAIGLDFMVSSKLGMIGGWIMDGQSAMGQEMENDFCTYPGKLKLHPGDTKCRQGVCT